MPPKAQNKRKKEKWQKTVDITSLQLEGAVADDIIVVVMGPTGVGKSTFVKCLITGKVDDTVDVVIGEDLDSCTVNLQPIPIVAKNVPFSLEGRGKRLVIVDTPGFDPTSENDSVVVTRIANWLASSYSKDMKLGGVIYLDDISQPRMLPTNQRNFEIFQALCGNAAAKATILCTTKWGAVTSDIGAKREKQLGDKFWKDVVEGGACMKRFTNTSGSAWNIVEALLKPNIEAQILRIQEELVELEKIISTTDAGKMLRFTIQEVLEMQKNSEPQSKIKEKLQSFENLRIDTLHRLKLLLGGAR